MPISSTTNKVVYDGDDDAKVFAFSYPIKAESEMGGVIYNKTTGAETALDPGVNCTVTVADDKQSASVTISTTAGSSPYGVLSASEKVFLNREVPYTNALDFRNHDGLLAENLDEAIDRLEMKSQRLQEQVDRCLKIQISEDNVNPDITIDTELPSLTGIDADGKYLKFTSDDDATPVYTLSYDEDTITNSVIGPGSSTDDAIARFNGTDGITIQNSGCTIDDSNNMTVAGTLTSTGATTLSTSVTLASGATVTSILDEDNMASDSATALATQQSIKAYVDAVPVGDVVGPASSTDNAITRFDSTTGKLLQNSGCTIDDSNNMTVAGDLTVSGNDIYSGSGTISTDFDNNRGQVNLELVANTNETSRILLQGDKNDLTASCALCMFDENGGANQKTIIFELGLVTDRASISTQNDNGTNGREFMTFDMTNEEVTFAQNATFNGLTVSTGHATVTSGNLTVTAGDLTVTAGGITAGGDLTVGDGFTAATIDIDATSASNAAIDFNEAGVTRWRFFKNSSAALTVNRYNASGVFQGIPLQIDSAGDVDIANDLTVTAGDLTVTSGTATFGGDVNIGNIYIDEANSNIDIGDGGVGVTQNNAAIVIDDNAGGAISIGVPSGGNRSIWFAGPTEVDEAQFQYQETNKTLAIGTKVAGGDMVLRTADNQACLTLDDQQDATFAGDITADTITSSTGLVEVGVEDTTAGRVNIRGDNDASGGLLYLFNSANEDATVNAYLFQANGSVLNIGTNTDSNALQFDASTGDFKVTAGGLETSGTVTCGTDSHSANGNADNLVIAENAAEVGINILSSTTGNGNIFFGTVAGANGRGRIIYDNSPEEMSFYVAAGEALTIDGSQNVEITSGDLTVTAGEVFLNLPTSAGTSGSLYNDGGTVKVSP